MRAPISARMLARLVWTEADCWEFSGARAQGYGALGRGGRGQGRTYAHRVSYEHFIGPIPQGLHIDHLCRNRSCCNPLHLEAVTQAENNRRAKSAKPLATHCKRGHEFNSENTSFGTHQRVCLACRRLRYAEGKVA